MFAFLTTAFCRVVGHADSDHENGLVTVRYCSRCGSLRVRVNVPVHVNLFWFTQAPDEAPSGLPSVVVARQLSLPNESTTNG